jgi:hypothetical protein
VLSIKVWWVSGAVVFFASHIRPFKCKVRGGFGVLINTAANKRFKRDKIKLAVLFTPFTYFSQHYFAP